MPVMSGIESAFCRSAPWGSFARRVVLPWALDGHQLTGDVLEIGGGSGAMADGVARRFPSAHLTVTDVDGVMVSASQARLVHHQHVTARRADLTALPFDDASFDAVTSYLMLHHVIAWQEALAEAARVLRPAAGSSATTSPTREPRGSSTVPTDRRTGSSRPRRCATALRPLTWLTSPSTRRSAGT